MSKLLNVSQTAAYFKVSTQSVHYWIKTGKLKATRVNGSKNRVYISTTDIAKYEMERANNKTKAGKSVSTKKEGKDKSEKQKEIVPVEKVANNDLDDFSSTVIEMLNSDANVAMENIVNIFNDIHSKQDVTIRLFNQIMDQVHIIDDIFDLIYDELDSLC